MVGQNMNEIRKPPKGGTRFPQDSLANIVRYIKGLCSKTHIKPIDINQLNSGVFGLGASSATGKVKSSSMKQYGLLDGGYKGFSASKLAKEINMASPEEKIKYYKKAFMNVSIFKKTFETFQNSTVDKSKISKYAVNPMKVHPDKAKLFSQIFIDSAKIAGLCSVKGDEVSFEMAPYVEKEVQNENELLNELENENTQPENENQDFHEEKSNSKNPLVESKNPNLEIKIDPSLDPEKLEKQLQVLKKFGLIK